MKEIYDKTYLEVIPNNAWAYINNLYDTKVILTLEEIKKYNEEIKEKSKALYDLNSKSLTKKEVLKEINKYTIPQLPKYDGSYVISNEDINKILDNRNIDKIEEQVILKKGLTVNRANLRAFPTDIHFFDKINDKNFDRIQETELHLNTPLLVLHESKDKNFYLVRSETYIGWVKKEDIVLVSDDDFAYFTNNDKFVIVTDAYIKIENLILDMSTKLPFKEVKDNGYEVVIPSKDKEDNLIKEKIVLTRDKAHIGYLNYTYRNLYIQAFKYEGLPYSWSGLDFGVDCSSYVVNVYGTFGLVFPRNTSNQNSSVGKIINLEGLSKKEKLDRLKGQEVNLLYEEGHVLIYLGMKNNKHYVINASGNRNILKVVEEELDSSYLLDNINKLVLVR